MIYLNEHYRFLERPPALATQFLEQTQPPHWLRRAFGLRVLRSTEGQSEGASLTAMKAALIESLTALPDSLALHHMLGVCQKLLGEHDAADATLANVVEGSLTLYADDPPPVYYGRISSAFLPPSSMAQLFSCSPHCAATLRPVAVEPVK